jgi:hypothetical protein
MRSAFDDRLKKITAACVLSVFTAGVICALASPSTADKAAVIAISVNRTTKGDRLPLQSIAQPVQQDVSSTKKPIAKRALPGCESAFSPLTDPTRGRLLTLCTS